MGQDIALGSGTLGGTGFVPVGPGGGGVTPALTNNIPLSSITNKKSIQFNTIEIPETGESSNYSEGHEVGLSSYVDGISLATNEGSKTEKFVIKISSDDKYYLKFHLPKNSSSIMYITFCEKNTSYRDGYKDFAGLLPQAYIDALVSWCNTGQNIPSSREIRKKELTFNIKGRISGSVASSIPFKVVFKYKIGTSQNQNQAWEITEPTEVGTTIGGFVFSDVTGEASSITETSSF